LGGTTLAGPHSNQPLHERVLHLNAALAKINRPLAACQTPRNAKRLGKCSSAVHRIAHSANPANDLTTSQKSLVRVP
jgi:hypothetical protein